MTELFASFFPNDDMVPENYRIASPIEQRQYLCDGAIKEWSGPQHDVLSPICEASGNTVRQRIIGSYPLQTEEQAMEALDAACRAYDHGRGPWPTMSVEERIRHVEAFAYGMQEQRHPVTNNRPYQYSAAKVRHPDPCCVSLLSTQPTILAFGPMLAVALNEHETQTAIHLP